jgi:hypothetical protein
MFSIANISLHHRELTGSPFKLYAIVGGSVHSSTAKINVPYQTASWGNIEEPVFYRDTFLNFSKLRKAKCLKIIIRSILCTQATVLLNLTNLATSYTSFRMGASFIFLGKHPRPLHLYHISPVCAKSFLAQ